MLECHCFVFGLFTWSTDTFLERLKGARKGIGAPGLRHFDKALLLNTLAQLLLIYKLAVAFLLVPHFDKGTDNFTRSEDNEWTCIFEGF